MQAEKKIKTVIFCLFDVMFMYSSLSRSGNVYVLDFQNKTKCLSSI